MGNDGMDKTKLENVLISIKTTYKVHKKTNEILAKTWIPDAIDQFMCSQMLVALHF